MVSQIDPSLPADGVPAVKSDLRTNLQAAKDEIEALQTGKSNLGHTHLLADVSDAGSLAGRNDVQLVDVTDAGALAGLDDVDGLAIDMQDQLLTRPELKDYSETSATPTISAGALTLDLETGNVFETTLTEDVTTFTLANPPAAGRAGTVTLIVRQDGTGGRTVTWPASNSVEWRWCADRVE